MLTKVQPSSVPRLSNAGLASVHTVESMNQFGERQQTPIVGELPLTIKVDNTELVTLMTLGTDPEKLVLGYLRNQTLFDTVAEIESVEVDWDAQTAEVVTHRGEGVGNVDLSQRTVTSGCGQGSLLSCVLDKIYDHRQPQVPVYQSDIYQVLHKVAKYNQVYRAAGSVHSCGLCAGDEVLMFYEDVGRHNAMDTIAGDMWLNNISGEGKVFYTTGRLTSEIVMKAALMGVPVLVSRNGATHLGYELAVDLGIVLIARAKSRQFVALNAENMVFDAPPAPRHQQGE